MRKSTLDREQWLTKAAELIQSELIIPNLPQGHNIPHAYRVSVGYPPRSSARSKTIAVCIKARASKDQHNEIFITPAIDDSIEVLAALVHEMVHQADDCASGHKNFFAKVARAVGLEGKLTATTAGSDLTAYLQGVIDYLGDIPHAAINLDQAKKKQATRMIKVTCQSCDWSFRTSAKNIEAMTSTECLCCGATDNGLTPESV